MPDQRESEDAGRWPSPREAAPRPWSIRSKRPRGVTLLALGVFLLAAANWLRFWKGIGSYERLASLDLSVPPWYLPLSGFVWGSVGLAAAVGLWLERPWARRLTLGASVLYALAYWADRLFLASSAYLRQSIPFAALATLVWLAFIWIVLTRSSVRQRLHPGDVNDSGPEDRTTS